MHLLAFHLDSQRFAMRLDEVERVLRAVTITPVPGAPPTLQGILNHHGQMLPMVDIRGRFSLPPQPPEADHRIILARARECRIAFFVDFVEGLVEVPKEEVQEASGLLPDMKGPIEGFGRFSDETILVYSVDNLFTLEELVSFQEVADEAGERDGTRPETGFEAEEQPI